MQLFFLLPIFGIRLLPGTAVYAAVPGVRCTCTKFLLYRVLHVPGTVTGCAELYQLQDLDTRVVVLSHGAFW